MARKPIHTEEEIIEAGEALELEMGTDVSGWQIHQKMGGHGRPSRVEQVWQSHLEARAATASRQADVPLPTPIQTALEAATSLLRSGVEKLLLEQRRALLEEHQRQLALQHCDHADEIAAARAEARRYRDEAAYLRSLLDDAEDAADDPE